jgi:TusA-related sulfurtransferase
MGGDGISVVITDPGWTAEVEEFITQFESIVLSEEGAAATITQITITS